jgi:hypothetical protein
MGPTELKMQHTIHLEGEAGHLPRPYPALPSKDTYCGFNFLFRRVHYYSLNTLYNIFFKWNNRSTKNRYMCTSFFIIFTIYPNK